MNLAVTKIVQTDSAPKDISKITSEFQYDDEVLLSLSEVAAHALLLGLNSTIKLAKTMEHSPWFSSNVEEIREITVTNTNAVKEIKDVLHMLRNERNLVDYFRHYRL